MLFNDTSSCYNTICMFISRIMYEVHIQCKISRAQFAIPLIPSLHKLLKIGSKLFPYNTLLIQNLLKKNGRE